MNTHKLLVILGLSVLLYKASAIGELEENGTGGINEKELIRKVIPDNILNKIESYGGVLKVPTVIEFDESKTHVSFNDKEAYKGTILMLVGMIYYSLILYIIYETYSFFKRIFITFLSFFKKKEDNIEQKKGDKNGKK